MTYNHPLENPSHIDWYLKLWYTSYKRMPVGYILYYARSWKNKIEFLELHRKLCNKYNNKL